MCVAAVQNVESLYENSIRRLKLTKRETTFEIEKGEDDIATILRSRGNVFQHDASYRTKKWVTHIATLGMNRARRWTIFPGEIGMALYTPTNTVFQLVAGNHYLAPGVQFGKKMTLPTGLESSYCFVPRSCSYRLCATRRCRADHREWPST